MDQINFFGELFETYKETLAPDGPSGQNDKFMSRVEDKCDGDYFIRLKAAKWSHEERLFNDYISSFYSTNDPLIIMDIVINQDSVKSINERQSTQILDFLGDIGGFKEALIIILATLGEYFSAKMFVQKVGTVLYLEKGSSPSDSDQMEGGQGISDDIELVDRD